LQDNRRVMEIYNARGQLLQKQNRSQTFEGAYKMDLRDLSANIYFMKCLIAEQVLMWRLVLIG